MIVVSGKEDLAPVSLVQNLCHFNWDSTYIKMDYTHMYKMDYTHASILYFAHGEVGASLNVACYKLTKTF